MSDAQPFEPATGEMSWFCCGSAWGPCGSAGGGACGTCNSGSHQCAWPNASAACYAITQPYACGHNLAQRGCGHVFTITNQCNGSAVTASVADCGPNTHQFCGERNCCGSACGTDRMIDLTPSAFSAIASLSSGLLPCTIV
ncbi:MAG: hypothetical protein WCA46_30340 [Actinocatenispora sp.]